MAENQVNAVVAALAAPVTPEVTTPEKPEGTTAPGAAPTTPEVKTTDKGVDANVPDPTKPDPKKDEKADPAAKPADAQPNETDDPYGLTPEIAANPQVKSLVEKADLLQKFEDLLVEGYSIPLEDQQGKKLPPEQVMASLRLERADAHALYDVVNGRQPVEKLLGMLIDPQYKYPQEVAERVFSQAVDYFAKIQFLQSYFTANGLKIVRAEDPAASADLNAKPADNTRIANLESELAKSQTAERQRQQNEAAQQVQAQRATVEKSFVDKVTELVTKKGLDASLLNDYIKGVSDQVNGQPAVLQRIAKGNWADVNRYFTNYHNQMLERARKYGQSLSTSKTSIQNKVPNAPAGGSAPAASAPKKRSFANQEDRVSAIAEMLKEQS